MGGLYNTSTNLLHVSRQHVKPFHRSALVSATGELIEQVMDLASGTHNMTNTPDGAAKVMVAIKPKQ